MEEFTRIAHRFPGGKNKGTIFAAAMLAFLERSEAEQLRWVGVVGQALATATLDEAVADVIAKAKASADYMKTAKDVGESEPPANGSRRPQGRRSSRVENGDKQR